MSVATDREPKKTAAEIQAEADEAKRLADEAKSQEDAGLKEVGAPAMDFIARALNQTAKPKKEKKKEGDDAPPPDDADPDADPDAEDLEQVRKLKPAPKKKPAAARPPPAAAFDEEKLGEAVGRAVAAATKAKETEKPAPVADDVPDVHKRRIAVLKQMEAQFGERYKGLADRYTANLKKHKEYAAKWEEEHPGEEYNEDDDEHADFLDTLEKEAAYEEDDYVEALTELKLSDRMKKVDEQVTERLKPIEQQEKLAAHRPRIIETRDKIGNRFWEKMGDEFSDVLKDGQINGEVLQELAQADPDTHAVVVNAAKAAERYAAETYLLDHRLREFDPKNEMHQDLRAFVEDREARMAAKHPEDTADEEGRTFLPRAEFNKLTERQRAKHWTFTHEDIGFLMAARIAKATKAFLAEEEEKFARRAAARGVSLEGHSRPVKSRKAIEDDEEEREQPTRKPVSPTSQIRPRMSPASMKTDDSATTGVQGFLSRAFAKR